MKISNLYLLLGMLIFSACAVDDPDSPKPSEVFVKYYGNEANEAVDFVSYLYMEEDQEKTGFIILGKHDDGSQTDYYIIKTDEQGNQVAAVTLDLDTMGYNDEPKRIKKVLREDGEEEFLLVGYSETGSGNNIEGKWFRMDESLNIVGSIYTMNGVETVDIIKLAGFDQVLLIGNNSAGNITLSKRTYQDEEIWTKSKYGFTNGVEKALAVFENPDGNLILMGSTTSNSGQGVDVYILETNSLGQPNSGFSPGALEHPFALESADDVPTAAIRTPTGYAITGYTTVNGDTLTAGLASFVMEISNSAEITKTHIFQFKRSSDMGFSESQALGLTRQFGGEYLITGSLPSRNTDTGVTGKQEEIMVMRVSPADGFVPRLQQHAHAYGRVTGNDRGSAVKTMPDGDIMLAATVDFGSGNTLICLMRLNQNGALVN